jgi:hypothetical protein
MKDFYDIYYLARTFNFEGIMLQSAIFKTLQRRGTPYEDEDRVKNEPPLPPSKPRRRPERFLKGELVPL